MMSWCQIKQKIKQFWRLVGVLAAWSIRTSMPEAPGSYSEVFVRRKRNRATLRYRSGLDGPAVPRKRHAAHYV